MERGNIISSEVKKRGILNQVLNKYNPTLSARDNNMLNPLDNLESRGFAYTEEDHSYDDREP